MTTWRIVKCGANYKSVEQIVKVWSKLYFKRVNCKSVEQIIKVWSKL